MYCNDIAVLGESRFKKNKQMQKYVSLYGADGGSGDIQCNALSKSPPKNIFVFL